MFFRARGHCAGRLGDEPSRLDPYHSKFWRKAAAGTWEPETFAVLYGARKARRVWCFEPDPEAFRALAWNIALNRLDNVSAFAVALSREVGVARMAGFRGEKGDSTTSLLNPDGAAGSDVLTIGFQDFARAVDLGRVSLVKMDVEGAEFDVLPTLIPWLRETRPALFLSTHAPFLDPADRARRMTELVESLGFYSDWRDATGHRIQPGDLTTPEALTRFRAILLSA